MASAEQALAFLLDLLDDDLDPPPRTLFDMALAANQLRRFKLDVSFALSAPGSRFSVNDTGEPIAFRQRIGARAPALHLPAPILNAFLGLSPPGDVQTTIGFKWSAKGGTPERISLYYEELTRSPAGASLLDRVPIAFEAALPALDEGLSPAAICIDVAHGQLIGFKDYGMAEERGEEPVITLPATLEDFRAGFPRDPERGTRRYLVARRFDREGRLCGRKLLWQSEAHTHEAATRAWEQVERLGLSLPAKLHTLRRAWPLDDLCLYPDLVSLDTNADDDPIGITVYVSVK